MAQRGRKATKSTRPLRDYVVLGIAAAAVLALAGYAVTSGGGDGVGQAADATGPVTIAHVHALAVDPGRPGELLVATHHGLVRRTDAGEWTRIGPLQDYMGFTVHPTEGATMWASGHPATGGNLGVIRSTDGGATWQGHGLEGVDFHAMTVSPADPDVLWGYFHGALYRAEDGGASWEVVNATAPHIVALAGDAQDRETLYATTDAGLQRSLDGGRTFSPLARLEAFGLAAHPTEAETLVAAGAAGLLRSADGGATWTLVATGFGGGRAAYVAIDPSAPSTLFVATLESGIYRSADGGETWTEIHAPTR
jgi:hypothetical protein